MKKYNTDSHRNMYLGVGFLVALSMSITAFEWESPEEFVPIVSSQITDTGIEIIMPTTIPEPKPPKVVVPEKIIESTEPEIEPLDDIIIDQSDIVDFDFTLEIAKPEPEEIIDVFINPETPAEPESGYSEFYKRVASEIKYPRQAQNLNVQGKVFIEFVVNKKGELSEVKVVRGIGAGCDEEAVRALLKAGNWKPGKQRGVPVKVRMVIPINFQMQ